MDKEEVKKAIKCSFCNNRPFEEGTVIKLVSEEKDRSFGVLLPMCAYHTVLSKERMISLTTKDNKIITVKGFPKLEKLVDSSLLVRSKLSRSPQLKKESNIAKIILNARKLQSNE